MGITLHFSVQEKIIGYTKSNNCFIPLNFILIYARKYIFWCARNDFDLNFFMLQTMLKRLFLEEENLAKINFKFEHFNLVWGQWKQLLLKC